MIDPKVVARSLLLGGLAFLQYGCHEGQLGQGELSLDFGETSDATEPGARDGSLSLPRGADAAATRGQPLFRFTVTSDVQGGQSHFDTLAQQINSIPEVSGPGAFHIMVGDIDDSVQATRDVIDDNFGASALWYPVIGNHEENDGTDLAWLRDEYDNGHGVRTALKDYTNQDGPVGTTHLTYSFDHQNAHFIVLNLYWDGGTSEGVGPSSSGDDTATDGDVVPQLYNWLQADLEANTRPLVFVFGHEPAFPENRHVGNSLDKYPNNRDAFWALLESHGVSAYMSGHTHYHSTHQGDKDHIGEVWQLDTGTAGLDLGNGFTFFDVVVSDVDAVVNVYRDPSASGTFTQSDAVTIPIPGPEWTISGYVRDGVDAPIEGVVLAADTGQSDTTDSAGYYAISVPSGWSGTVTPGLGDAIFDPAEPAYADVVADLGDQNYVYHPCDCGQVSACCDGCNALNEGEVCDDGLFCTGVDTCDSGSCGVHSGNPCPGQTCEEASGQCVSGPIFAEDFENGNVLGWSLAGAGSTASTGDWEVGDPLGTSTGGQQAQPADPYDGLEGRSV